MDKLLLIDGNSLVYRAYYGSSYSPAGVMRNSQNIPVNAILTTNKMIDNIISRYNPTHVLIAFDAGKITRRHSKLPTYKANRQSTPQELIVQFPLIKDMISKMGIKYFELSGVEADDIIASLSEKYKHTMDVLVVSTDKDLLQLVDKKINVIIPQGQSKDNLVVTENNFFEIFEFQPNQVTDIKGLMGDSSDNLPGVKGIGKQGAINLIKNFSSLENIYNSLESISQSVSKKLELSREMAFLCKELATLDKSIEIPFNLNELRYFMHVTQELIDFCQDLELNSLVKKYKSHKSDNIVW